VNGLVLSRSRCLSKYLSIEHSAPTTHGSSGGPVLDEVTKVVGVTYGGEGPQSLAILGDEAQGVIGHLKKGDYESIGVNGEAEGEIPEMGLKGYVRVDSVKTGSPADKAGVKGLTYFPDMGHYTQDYITKLEGTDLAINGTMQEYCNVIRSAGARAPLSIEVQRVSFTTDGKPIGAVTLTGTLNGSKLQQQETEPHSMG
jgi:serine protease Do